MSTVLTEAPMNGIPTTAGCFRRLHDTLPKSGFGVRVPLHLVSLGKVKRRLSTRIAGHASDRSLIEHQPCLGHANWNHRDESRFTCHRLECPLDFPATRRRPGIVRIAVDNNKVYRLAHKRQTREHS